MSSKREVAGPESLSKRMQTASAQVRLLSTEAAADGTRILQLLPVDTEAYEPLEEDLEATSNAGSPQLRLVFFF